MVLVDFAAILAGVIGVVVPFAVYTYYRQRYRMSHSIGMVAVGAFLFVNIAAFIIISLFSGQSEALTSGGMEKEIDIFVQSILILTASAIVVVIQEMLRYIVFLRVLKPEEKTKEHARVYGAAYGGISMFTLVVLSFVVPLMLSLFFFKTVDMDMLGQMLSETQNATREEVSAQLQLIEQQKEKILQLSPTIVLRPVVEGTVILVINVFSSLLMMESVIRNDRWLRRACVAGNTAFVIISLLATPFSAYVGGLVGEEPVSSVVADVIQTIVVVLAGAAFGAMTMRMLSRPLPALLDFSFSTENQKARRW